VEWSTFPAAEPRQRSSRTPAPPSPRSTALAAAHFKHKGEPLSPVWAAGCAGNVAAFPVLDLKLTVLVDHDEEGEESANECLKRYRAAGHDPGRLWTKEPGTDFNDLLIARRKGAA
jgi:hypothetical protein